MKNKIVKRILTVGLSITLAMGTPIFAGNGLTDATVQSYEDQLAALAQKQQQALNQLAEIRSDKSDTWTEMAALDEVMKYNTDLKKFAEEQLDAVTASIEATKQNISDIEEKISAQEQAFLERMVANYMEDDADYIELILGATDLVDFLTKMERVNAILKYDRDIITNLEANRVALNDEKEKLLEREATEDQRIKDFEQAILQNQMIYDEKLTFIKELEQDEVRWTNDYTYNKQLENEINAELEEYLAELQRKSQSVYVGGTGGWPLESGAYYHVSSEQGWRDLYGVQDYHLGIDLACANGTNVYAYNSGTVLKSEYHYSYGNYVLVDHGGGISTLYAHMSERAVSVGDTVTAGQLLGYVGLTGNTYGYHLHFEVRENGSVVNPRNYLAFP